MLIPNIALVVDLDQDVAPAMLEQPLGRIIHRPDHCRLVFQTFVLPKVEVAEDDRHAEFVRWGPFVQADLADGQEYDGLVFLGDKFYSEYNGTAKSNLIAIGTHEIAHQWWFGLVGDDQAREPWLDEALAVYSERIFYQYDYPNFGDWWWSFRVDYFGPQGYVDSSVYDFSTFRAYVNAVYLNGAEFLDDLRTRVGDDAFFGFLKDYAASFAHGHATTSDFFAVLRQHTHTDFSDIVRTYFQGQY